MRSIKFSNTYKSQLSTEEFRNQVESILNKKELFGLVRYSGELTKSTFKIKGPHSSTSKLSFTPVVFGSFKKEKDGTTVDLKITPGFLFYFVEILGIIIVMLVTFNSGTTINGNQSTLSERLIFGSLFITSWTLVLLLYNFFSIRSTKKKIQAQLKLIKTH